MFYDTNELTPEQLQQAFAAAQATANNMTPQSWQQLQANYPRLYSAVADVRGHQPVTAPDKHHKEGVPLWTIDFMYRRILVHCPIVPETVRPLQMETRYLTSSILEKDPANRKVIGIYYLFDSPGGSVDYGLRLRKDMIRAQSFNNEPVFTVIEGIGASMGSLLPQSASFGCRFMREGSKHMIHNLLWAAPQQKQAEHERGMGDSRNLSAILYNVYLQRIVEHRRLMLGETVTRENEAEILYDLLRDMEEHDSWLTPAESMEYGLSDFTYLDEAGFTAYRKKLLWYHGFARLDTPEDSQEEGLVENEGKEHIPLSDEERELALQEIRRLRKANYEEAKALEEEQVPEDVLRVKKMLAELQQEAGNGPPSRRGRDDLEKRAIKAFVDRARDEAAEEAENNDNDDE